MDGAGFAEAHLALLRMDIDVHMPRIEHEPQCVGRLAVVMQHVPVRLAQRVHHHAIPDEAAVDEHVLARHLRCVCGLHREAPDTERPGLCIDRRGALDERRAEQRGDPRSPSVRLQPLHQPPVVLQREADVRIGERDAAERLVAMAPLGRFGAQKLPPRGGVEIELLHGHGRAGRNRRRCRRTDIAAVDLDAPCVRRCRRARRKRKPRHRRHRRQRLAAKAQRRDGVEIVRRRELRRRMPLHRERQLVAGYPCAVVGHTDAPDAATLEIHVDLGRARIERIL